MDSIRPEARLKHEKKQCIVTRGPGAALCQSKPNKYENTSAPSRGNSVFARASSFLLPCFIVLLILLHCIISLAFFKSLVGTLLELAVVDILVLCPQFQVTRS